MSYLISLFNFYLHSMIYTLSFTQYLMELKCLQFNVIELISPYKSEVVFREGLSKYIISTLQQLFILLSKRENFQYLSKEVA